MTTPRLTTKLLDVMGDALSEWGTACGTDPDYYDEAYLQLIQDAEDWVLTQKDKRIRNKILKALKG